MALYTKDVELLNSVKAPTSIDGMGIGLALHAAKSMELLRYSCPPAESVVSSTSHRLDTRRMSSVTDTATRSSNTMRQLVTVICCGPYDVKPDRLISSFHAVGRTDPAVA